jgi:hypothetical protein
VTDLQTSERSHFLDTLRKNAIDDIEELTLIFQNLPEMMDDSDKQFLRIFVPEVEQHSDMDMQKEYYPDRFTKLAKAMYKAHWNGYLYNKSRVDKTKNLNYFLHQIAFHEIEFDLTKINDKEYLKMKNNELMKKIYKKSKMIFPV